MEKVVLSIIISGIISGILDVRYDIKAPQVYWFFGAIGVLVGWFLTP